MLACGWNAFHRRGGRWAPESDTKRLACGCLQMAMSTKLMMRQGQTLVMTPQLLQAIKLLQFSNLELSAFLHEELERNPLLERMDGDDAPARDAQTAEAFAAEFDAGATENFIRRAARGRLGAGQPRRGRRQPRRRSRHRDRQRLRARRPAVTASDAAQARSRAPAFPPIPGAAPSGAGEDGEAPNLEAYVAADVQPPRPSRRAARARLSPIRATGSSASRSSTAIDETGYLREDVRRDRRSARRRSGRVDAVLALIQTFDPSGVGARDLAECLAIQLRERDRSIRRCRFSSPICRCSPSATSPSSRGSAASMTEDVADMAAEVRRLDPKPGRAFGGAPIQPLVADVIVRPATDGSWHRGTEFGRAAARSGQSLLCGAR